MIVRRKLNPETESVCACVCVSHPTAIFLTSTRVVALLSRNTTFARIHGQRSQSILQVHASANAWRAFEPVTVRACREQRGGNERRGGREREKERAGKKERERDDGRRTTTVSPGLRWREPIDPRSRTALRDEEQPASAA